MNTMSVQLLPYLEWVYILANICILFLYGYDKLQAERERWRISEKNLLIGAFLGPFGAFLAMQIFRHKTQKTLFSLMVPTFMVLHAILITLILLKVW